MKIHIRYFGMIADRLNRASEEVEWEGGAVPVDLRTWLIGLRPDLADMSWKIALDQEIVEGSCFLRDSSEIVLLPPFAGG